MAYAIDMVLGIMRLAFLVAVFGWTMVLLHYVLFDRLARRRRARWERDRT
jgi:hypothetical protein